MSFSNNEALSYSPQMIKNKIINFCPVSFKGRNTEIDRKKIFRKIRETEDQWSCKLLTCDLL